MEGATNKQLQSTSISNDSWNVKDETDLNDEGNVSSTSTSNGTSISVGISTGGSNDVSLKRRTKGCVNIKQTESACVGVICKYVRNCASIYQFVQVFFY